MHSAESPSWKRDVDARLFFGESYISCTPLPQKVPNVSILFLKIVEACEENCRYFTQRRNVAGLKGFSAYQKISAAMRVIAYGVPADYADEYLRIGEDSTIESVRRFAKVIVRVFGPEYLQAPNQNDTKKLMASNERRGWPGMLGSIDCMH